MNVNMAVVPAVNGDGRVDKAAALRGFVTERLAAASREILTAVERAVAEYEEEASGFRREIDRQKSQLELLLQPRVALSAAGVKHNRSLGPVEEKEDEDEKRLENLDLTDPSSSGLRRCQYGRRKLGRPRISDRQNHLDLRIRILENSQTNVLSKTVLGKCPIRKLKCPRGLQEADFLDLLRSAFPQLSGEPFDVLTSDKRRRLRRLELKTLTPEEIHRNIRCTGWGTPTVCIRLKRRKERPATEDEIHPLQTENDSSALLPCEGTSSVEEVEGKVVSSSSTAQQQRTETEENDDEEPAVDFVTCSVTEGEGAGSSRDEKEDGTKDVNDSDDNWKPDESDDELKESDSNVRQKKKKLRRSAAARTKTENSVAAVSCKVCGALNESEAVLLKHAWNHMNDPGSVCGVCGQRSESAEVLMDHLQSEHKADDCHICGESFLSALSFNEHVAAHSGEKPYACSVCHATFALKATLEHHQKLHAAGKLHKCYTCHKVFDLKEQLKTHRRTHANRKSHLCGVCGKSLSDYRSLSRHKMTHSGDRPHSCQVCGRRFKLAGTLRQHEKIHTNRERSYLCDVCCKMFLTSQQLQIHMRRHTNEKPYHCGECGKGFSTKGPLTVHMRVHTGETPYRCPDCGWSFKRKTNLDNHVAVHSGVKPFVCGICGKACARKSYLTVHMRTHNGERPYKCALCDKAFTQSHCLKTHMKSHQVAESETQH